MKRKKYDLITDEYDVICCVKHGASIPDKNGNCRSCVASAKQENVVYPSACEWW